MTYAEVTGLTRGVHPERFFIQTPAGLWRRGSAGIPTGFLTREAAQSRADRLNRSVERGSRPITDPCIAERCDRQAIRRGRCSSHYGEWLRITPLADREPPNELERFWSKVDKNGPTIRGALGPCWIWTDGRQLPPFDYGVFHIERTKQIGSGSTSVGAHRYALALALGRPIRAELFARHLCDNPPCVNNEGHLSEGTSQENVDDAVARGRHKVGVMDPNAKLSAADVLAIRVRAAAGELRRALAAEYGVAESLISGIVRGHRWRHVGGPITRKYIKGK